MTACLISLVVSVLGLLVAMALGLRAQHNFWQRLCQTFEDDKQ